VDGDLLASRHQLPGLAPVGPRAAGQDLETAHRRPPGRVFGREILHDATHQRQRALGLLQREQLELGHD